jgi:muramoyltetrapeptide carboxypeptidase LdcA involved in peptidoglycan recycling
LDGLAGLLLGRFSSLNDEASAARQREEGVWARVLELCGKSSFPIWGGLPWGHGEENCCLPLGMEAVMDSSSGMLRFVTESGILL